MVQECSRDRWQQAHPGLDTSSMDVLAPLKQVQALIERALEPLFEGAPVTQTELDVLLGLRHADEPVIARALARQMGCSRAAVSKVLAKLEQRGLLTRETNPSDRRAALLRLTGEGERVVDTMFPRQLVREAELLDGLGADERARIIDGLGALAATLRRNAPGAD